MKKIFYIVSTLKRSGPTNQLYGLIATLSRDRYEPYVLTLSPESRDSRWSDFEQLNIQIESLNYQRLQGLFRNRKSVANVIDRVRPHLIHTSGFRADCVVSHLNLPSPRVAVIHNDPWFDFPKKFGQIQGSWMAWNHVRVIRHATIAIGCSETIARLFHEQYKVSNIRAIPNGVDTEKYCPVNQKCRKILREKLRISEEERLFLSASSLVKRKDLGTLIRGFRLANIEKSKLMILGDGSERSNLEKLAETDPSIEFRGNVANVDEYLAAADFFVSSSLGEGLPYSVLEAMASGLPVILSDIPSHRELLESRTLSESLLFPIKNESALANSLRLAVEANHLEMSDQLLAIIQEKFSTTRMTEKYQEVYDQCIQACGEKHV